MTESTPGPWAFTEGKNGGDSTIFKASDEGWPIARVICEDRQKQQRLEDVANARLIAESPRNLTAIRDTYQTLTDVLEFLNNGTPIRNGSDLHADLIVRRDQLQQAIKASVNLKEGSI